MGPRVVLAQITTDRGSWDSIGRKQHHDSASSTVRPVAASPVGGNHMQTIRHEYLAAGQQLQREGRLPQAEAAYRRVCEMQPGNALACHLLGLVVFQLGRSAEAIDLLRRSIELAPTNVEFRNNLAGMLGSLGRHEEAEQALREAVRIRPDFADAWNNLGVALEHLQRFEEAASALWRPCGSIAIISRLGLI